MKRRFSLLAVLASASLVCALAAGRCASGPEADKEVPDVTGADVPAGDLKADIPAAEVHADAPTEVAPDARAPVPESVELADEEGNVVTVSLDPLGIVATRGAEVVWDGSDSPLMLGFVETYSDDVRYDPELPADDVQWVTLENAVEYREEDDGARIVTYEPVPGRKVELAMRLPADGIVTFTFGPREWKNEVNARIRYRSADETENFYGLGENFDHVARRGTFRHMYHMVDEESESYYNEAHFPIPLLVSTNGSGLFVEERRPGVFDVCKEDPHVVSATFSAPSLKFHLLFAKTPLEVLTRYVEITGKPAVPPQWVFGILQWRNEVSGQAMVMDDAEKMREWDLPCSGIWVDRPFATGHESFVFDPDKYPDSAPMVQALNALGYRVGIWSAPYLSEDVPEAYETAVENGYFVESDDISFNQFGQLVDFTNPGLVELWQSLIGNATSIGIEGFKLDYGEDVLTGGLLWGKAFKVTANFHNGETEQTMHHWYHYFYHKTYQDTLEGDGFLLSRAGCFGDQTVTTVCWPGDLDSDFHYHREDGHVGGLPAAIAGGLSLSVSGYPFYGSDTGGFRHNRPSEEVLLRWVQQTSLSTVLQFGGGGDNHNPWDFKKYVEQVDGEEVISHYDEETVDIWRRYSRLHIRLFPYTYSYAVKAGETGVPVLRPLGMVHPELNQHPDFQYFFGEALWVAPVNRGGTTLEVIIPPGKWIGWFDREPHNGPETKQFDVPLDSLVLLVREGAIIPMLRETVDTLAPASHPEVDSYANDPGRLHVRVFPGPEVSTFTTVLGPAFSVTPEAGGFKLAWESATSHFTSVQFEIDLKNLSGSLPIPPTVSAPGGDLAEAASKAALEECQDCYFVDEEEMWLYVRPAGGDGAFSIK